MDTWIDCSWLWWPFVDMAMSQCRIVIAEERCPTGQGFKEHNAERIDIGSSIDGSSLALFGRHIFGCAHARSWTCEIKLFAGKYLCYTKIGEDRSVRSIHKDVDWLDISMDNALLVCIGKCVGQLGKDRDNLSALYRPPFTL